MKTRSIIRLYIVVACVTVGLVGSLFLSCNRNTGYSRAEAKNEIAAARLFFEQNAGPILARSFVGGSNPQSLTYVRPLPGDFTPIWMNARAATVGGASAVDVQIDADYRYTAIRRSNHDHTHSEPCEADHPVMAVQKIPASIC